MWSHGNLHQVRKEDERVPHLQAVRGSGRARLQVLKLFCVCARVRVAPSGVHRKHRALNSSLRMNCHAWRLAGPNAAAGTSNFSVSETRLLPLAYHDLFPVPSFTNSCSSPTSPSWWTIISCTGTALSLFGLLNTQQKPLPSLSLPILCLDFTHGRVEDVGSIDTWSGSGCSGRWRDKDWRKI